MAIIKSSDVSVHFTSGPNGVLWCRYCFRTHEVAEHEQCAHAAHEVFASEDFWTPEYVEGWRGFKVVVDTVSGKPIDPILKGMRTAWTDTDPGPAQCVGGGRNTGLSWDHKSPHALCTCGYHALKDRDMVRGDLPIHAKVEMWGDIIEHEDGYRAERIKLVGLDYNIKSSRMRLFKRHERVHGTLGKLRKRYKVGGIE